MSTPSEQETTAVAVAPIPQPATRNPQPATRPAKPAWQRHPLFKAFSSVKLAVVLLSVLIVASIAGTIYESSFDAKVARAYIYNAWWFNLWLAALCLNLACAAFSRMPWKRHHTGFLLTHLGIIILLAGAVIGRYTGIEGTMTLHKGEPPNNLLTVDERVLRVEQGGFETRQYPVEIIGRHPAPAHPWSLGRSAGGWDITLLDYAAQIDAQFEPQAAPALTANAQPAVRVRLVTQRVGATLDQWLLAGDPDHGALDLSGLATVQVRRGVAPEPGADATGPAADGQTVDESLVVFALHPNASIGQSAPGAAPSGATARLTIDPATGKRTVAITWQGATWTFDPAADGGKEQDLSGSGLNVLIEHYWPDFVMRDGQPASASDAPNNPAAFVRIHGHLPGAAADAGAATAPPAPPVQPGTPPPMGAGTQAGNQAVIYCDDAGNLTYTLKSRAAPAPVRGTLKPGEPIPTGWMDWRLEAVQAIPAAVARTTFRPVPGARLTGNTDKSATSGDPNVVNAGGGGAPGAQQNAGSRGEGVLVRLTRGAEKLEQWAAVGWQVTLPTTPQPTRLAYDSLIQGLPIGLQLENFEVEFNDGTDSPASFQSHLKATDLDGGVGRGSCSMNQPFNFPGHWWNTFSGMTYKMSQAQWNPADTGESTVQILRDPGWLFKWIGSLILCAGIFTLFYLRPPPKIRA